MPNAYIAACLDMSYDISPGFSLETECYSFAQYVNSGVVLFDLAAMRRDNIQERLLECAAEEHMMHDPSVLSIVCAGHVAVLPEKWNFCLHNWPFNPLITKEARQRSASILSSGEIGIIHYCSPRKPWAGNSLSPRAHLWWQEAERAPCCLQLKSRLLLGRRLLMYMLRVAVHCPLLMRLMYTWRKRQGA